MDYNNKSNKISLFFTTLYVCVLLGIVYSYVGLFNLCLLCLAFFIINTLFSIFLAFLFLRYPSSITFIPIILVFIIGLTNFAFADVLYCVDDIEAQIVATKAKIEVLNTELISNKGMINDLDNERYRVSPSEMQDWQEWYNTVLDDRKDTEARRNKELSNLLNLRTQQETWSNAPVTVSKRNISEVEDSWLTNQNNK